jgi:hypothetical protein
MTTQEMPGEEDSMPTAVRRITAVINAGRETGDHRRVEELLRRVGADVDFLFVTKNGLRKVMQIVPLARRISSGEPDLVFVEGTGIVGGLAAMLARRMSRGRIKYLISSGDAASRFARNARGPAAGLLIHVYEVLLYRSSFAFVGWTPYLVGRAIRMGAPRGLTVEGAAPAEFSGARPTAPDGATARSDLGLPLDALVVCVSGSLTWTSRQSYAYGLELTLAAPLVDRRDVRFLIVGDGTGEDELRSRAAGDDRFVFTGRVPHSDMPKVLAAADVAVISQTRDEIGLLRLTTKLPEYLALGVPVIVPNTPAMIDYLVDTEGGPAWFLPAAHPASGAWASSLARWIETADRDDIADRSARALRVADERFRPDLGAARLREFLISEEADMHGRP